VPIPFLKIDPTAFRKNLAGTRKMMTVAILLLKSFAMGMVRDLEVQRIRPLLYAGREEWDSGSKQQHFSTSATKKPVSSEAKVEK